LHTHSKTRKKMRRERMKKGTVSCAMAVSSSVQAAAASTGST
jgi:hypothetical protein